MTNLGLHTRLKSYDFKDIVRLVALLAISTKHCRRWVLFVSYRRDIYKTRRQVNS